MTELFVASGNRRLSSHLTVNVIRKTSREAENDSYEFVDAAGNDEFSHVSTQMLHRMLKGDDAPPEVDDDVLIDGGGFDPYNSD